MKFGPVRDSPSALQRRTIGGSTHVYCLSVGLGVTAIGWTGPALMAVVGEGPGVLPDLIPITPTPPSTSPEPRPDPTACSSSQR